MSTQAQLFQRPAGEPDLIDRIANALPEELRADYYRELSHCRALPENDEMLRILRAMQFLTVLIERAPAQVAVEREQLARVLARAIEAIQATHASNLAYQKQLEERISKLPEEICKWISAEAIAGKLSESLRQQFHQTGLPAVAEAIGVQATTLRQASKELSAALEEFAHPKNGAVSHVKESLAWMKADLKNAADHIRTQMNGLSKDLNRTIAVFCLSGVMIGFFLGMLFHRWIGSPAQPGVAAPTIPSKPSSLSTPQPAAKKRVQPGEVK